MKPMVKDGDIVRIEPIDIRKVRIGDVVLFVNELERVVLHRVIGISKYGSMSSRHFELMGDQALFADGSFDGKHILGRLSTIERQGTVLNINTLIFRLINYLISLRSSKGFGKNRFFSSLFKWLRKTEYINKYIG